MNKAIFIDKDGTLVDDVPYNVNPKLIRFTEGAIEALKKLKSRGYLLILVSNQSGIARGYFRPEALAQLEASLQDRLRESGVQLDAAFYCPHHPEGTVPEYAVLCECRKPKPGLLLKAAQQYNIDLSQSWMVGDILHDVEAGNTAGCQTILIDNGNETEWKFSEYRKPTAIARNLREAAEIIVQEFQPV